MSKRPVHVTGTQLQLDLRIAAEKEVDGVGMGVLSNGTPFLTIRGLARMCGVDHSAIIRITEGWQDDPLRPREQRIRELVVAQGADDSRAFIAVERNGTIYHAIPDAVCMAVLEYYALDAKSDNDHALKAYRTLARKGFNDFIYTKVGYNPEGAVSFVWRQFHDRVSLLHSAVPHGFFCVFREIADMVVTLIQSEAKVGPEFVPDISVGIHWSNHWKADNLDSVYGMRQRYNHNFPEYFPQSASNPQPAYCYPDDALPEFRKWMREEYLPRKMPEYVRQKVRQGQIPAPAAATALAAFETKKLRRV